MKKRASKLPAPRKSPERPASVRRKTVPRKADAKSKKPAIRAASTSDVLSNAGAIPPVPRKWADHYRRLIELRDRLGRERNTLKQNAGEEAPQFSQHLADAGTDSYDRDFALGLLSNEQDALYEIEQALDRIRNGTYGVCEITGKPIPTERLAAIPWTRFSAGAEKRLESEGQGEAQRARLGPREELPRSQAETAENETA